MDPVTEPPLASIFDRHYGNKSGFARKPKSYIVEYERLFAAIRHHPLRILELGVNLGESLLTWKDYFPNAVIVGIDISDRPQLITKEPRIHFVKGSQDDPKILDAAAAISGRPFDIIIDDASHIGYLTKRSFYYLFPRWLKPGGIYVIEDIGATFLFGTAFPVDESEDLTQSEVFPSVQHGILGVVKQVIDQTMKGMVTKTPSVLDIERVTFLWNIVIIMKTVAPPV